MDSRHLTAQQCEWITNKLSKMAHELCLLHKRMQERRFPADDKLYQLVTESYDAVLTAHHHAHSLWCQGSMGVTYFFRDEDGIGHTKPKSERDRETGEPPAG